MPPGPGWALGAVPGVPTVHCCAKSPSERNTTGEAAAASASVSRVSARAPRATAAPGRAWVSSRAGSSRYSPNVVSPSLGGHAGYALEPVGEPLGRINDSANRCEGAQWFCIRSRRVWSWS